MLCLWQSYPHSQTKYCPYVIWHNSLPLTLLNFQDSFQPVIVKEEGLEASIESVSFGSADEPDTDDDPGDEVVFSFLLLLLTFFFTHFKHVTTWSFMGNCRLLASVNCNYV